MGHLNLSSDQDIHVSLGFTFHAFVFMNLETIINTDSVLEYQFNKIISSCLRIIFFLNDKKSKVSSNHRWLPCQEIFWWIRISGFYKWILVSKTKKEKVIKLEYCLKGEWLITNVRRENSSMILLITRWFHTLSHVDRRDQFDSNAFDNFFFFYNWVFYLVFIYTSLKISSWFAEKSPEFGQLYRKHDCIFEKLISENFRRRIQNPVKYLIF